MLFSAIFGAFVILLALFNIHVECLDELSLSEIDIQANQVRREGVDSALLKYASMALPQGSMASIYDVALPPTLSGIESQVARLRSTNFTAFKFNEFSIPATPTFSNINNSTSLVFVYRKVVNFTIYSLPQGYEWGGPVVGIIAYPGNNISGYVDPNQVSELDISIAGTNKTSIQIELPPFSNNPSSTTTPLCGIFVPNGSIYVTNLTSTPNRCTSLTLGDFALILQSSTSTTSESPSISPSSPITTSSSSSKSSKNAKTIVAAVFISLICLVVLVGVAYAIMKLAGPLTRSIKSRFSKNDETLQISLVGASRAPTASTVRTKPALEMEMDMAQFTHD